MRRLLAAVACAAACGAAQAAKIPSYAARVDVAADGRSETAVQLQIDEAAPATLLVPLAASLKPAGPVRVDSAPPGTRVRSVEVAGRPHLEVVLPEGVAASVALALGFAAGEVMAEPKARAQGRRSLPKGHLLLDHSFVNTQPVTIGSYRVQVVLPEGTRFQEIREQTPKTRRTEVEPRVRLNAVDGRQGALLQLKDVQQGERAGMSLEVVRDHRSLAWLVVGLALAVAYLIGFRDLVSAPGAKSA